MPRVREIDDEGGDPILKEIFAKEREIFGAVLNTTKVYAHCPPVLKAAKQLSMAVERSGLLPRDEAIAHIKKAIEKTYGKRGPEVVRRNCEVVDQALHGDRPPGVDEQPCQEGSALGPADLKAEPVVQHLQRPEDPELHVHSPPPA